MLLILGLSGCLTMRPVGLPTDGQLPEPGEVTVAGGGGVGGSWVAERVVGVNGDLMGGDLSVETSSEPRWYGPYPGVGAATTFGISPGLALHGQAQVVKTLGLVGLFGIDTLIQGANPRRTWIIGLDGVVVSGGGAALGVGGGGVWSPDRPGSTQHVRPYLGLELHLTLPDPSFSTSGGVGVSYRKDRWLARIELGDEALLNPGAYRTWIVAHSPMLAAEVGLVLGR